MDNYIHVLVYFSFLKGLFSPSLLIILQVALAEMCAKCEHYIGTEGGGMDQSISFLAEKGTVRSFPGRWGAGLQVDQSRPAK